MAHLPSWFVPPGPDERCHCGAPITFVYMFDGHGGGYDLMRTCDTHGDSGEGWAEASPESISGTWPVAARVDGEWGSTELWPHRRRELEGQ